MSSSNTTGATTAQVEVPQISLSAALPWLIFAGLLAMTVIFFISTMQGAVGNGTAVHEFVHDGRHLLGFPCH